MHGLLWVFVSIDQSGLNGGYRLSTAVNALRDGGKVVWIGISVSVSICHFINDEYPDTGSPLPTPRLKKMLLKSISPSSPSASTTETILETLTQNLIYIHTPSLPHLLALLFHPPKHFPPAKTTLLVIDSVSGPFPSYYPNPTELKSRLISQNRIPGKSQIQWLMNRKWNVTSDLANQVMKIAATHRLAVFLVNQTQTRIKGQPRPILSPALAGGVWEGSVHARIVLYRDLLAEGDAQGFGRSSSKTRFAEVMKRGGKALSVRVDENIIPFCIERVGFYSISPFPPPIYIWIVFRLTLGKRQNRTVSEKLSKISNPPQSQSRPRNSHKRSLMIDLLSRWLPGGREKSTKSQIVRMKTTKKKRMIRMGTMDGSMAMMPVYLERIIHNK